MDTAKYLNKWTGYLILISMLWFSLLCILYWMCQSLLLYTARTLTDCWKCSGTISSHCPCNVSSFATVSPAHVRFTEHGSMPSYLAARRLLARRVREWRMRWHLHVSVCSLMTQRSFLSRLTFMLFVFVVLRTPRPPISSAAHLPRVLSQSYSFPHKLPLYTSVSLGGLAKKDMFNFNYLGETEQSRQCVFARKYYLEPQAARQAM